MQRVNEIKDQREFILPMKGAKRILVDIGIITQNQKKLLDSIKTLARNQKAAGKGLEKIAQNQVIIEENQRNIFKAIKVIDALSKRAEQENK
jgi:hypothetical protein